MVNTHTHKGLDGKVSINHVERCQFLVAQGCTLLRTLDTPSLPLTDLIMKRPSCASRCMMKRPAKSRASETKDTYKKQLEAELDKMKEKLIREDMYTDNDVAAITSALSMIEQLPKAEIQIVIRRLELVVEEQLY